jgi:hypothetical protein
MCKRGVRGNPGTVAVMKFLDNEDLGVFVLLPFASSESPKSDNRKYPEQPEKYSNTATWNNSNSRSISEEKYNKKKITKEKTTALPSQGPRAVRA